MSPFANPYNQSWPEGYPPTPADQGRTAASGPYDYNFGYPGYQQPSGYSYPAGYQPAASPWSGWLDFKNPNYLKGVLLAAGVTLLVTNPTVQKAVVKGLAKAWSSLQYGVEEVKEQINDIRAEMQFRQEQKAGDQQEAPDA